MNNKNGSYIFLRSTKLILILPLLMLSLSGCFWSEEEVKRESITKGLSPKAFFNEAKESYQIMQLIKPSNYLNSYRLLTPVLNTPYNLN